MEGTSSEHDLWMAKITNALRSFRMATQRKAEQTQARPPAEGRAHDDSRELDRA
jgi:hypothetical protein